MNVARILDERYALPADFRNGGMARVYKATDLDDGSRIVAVKILKQDLGSVVEALAFEREAKSLRRLKHPNIVNLLDIGKDAATKERYLVFDWMEEDLKAVIGDTPPPWEEYLHRWGIPILRGLAHAHEAQIAHRDLKPDNILVDPDQRPRITDFGIAKSVTPFEPGRTLRDWRSVPYAPNDKLDGLHTYTLDVHAYGVLSLLTMTGIDPIGDSNTDPHQVIGQALASIDCPEPLTEFLARCVSEDREARPEDAAVALASLQQLVANIEQSQGRAAPRILLSLSDKVRGQLGEHLELDSRAELERFVLDELKACAAVAGLPSKTFEDETPTDDHFYIFMGSIRLHALVNKNRNGLHLVGCLFMSPSYLEREREHAVEPDLEWRFSSADPGEETEAVRILERAVEEHIAEDRSIRVESADRLIARWRRLLTATRALEMERVVSVAYGQRTVKGRSVEFQCREDAPEELIGPVVIDAGEEGYVRGEVVAIEGRLAIFRVSDGDPREIDPAGELRTDTSGVSVAVNRQHRALDSLDEGRAVRSDLVSLLVDPRGARPPRDVPVEKWRQDVDDTKQEVVRRALGTTDVLHVEGPPGTGKTTLITELILQALGEDSSKRILLSAKTHAALDNVLERLAQLDPELRLIRAGRSDDPRVSEGAQKYLIDRQMKAWRKNVERRGTRFLKRWAKDHGVSETQVEIGTRFEELASAIERLDAVETELAPLEAALKAARSERRSGRTTAVEIVDSIARQVSELRARRKDLIGERDELINRLADLRAISSKSAVREQAPSTLRTQAKEAIPEKSAEVERCQQMIKVMGEWHARFGRGPGFNGAALIRAQVVAATCVGYDGIDGGGSIDFDLCIVDEASQATPSEVLIPMTRASSWVLVGDSKQLPPFADAALSDPGVLRDHGLRKDDVTETLFSRWRPGLAPECRASLSVQHRMAPPISRLISECFYGGTLKSARGAGRADLSGAISAPVTWYTTAASEKRFESQDGTSWVNQLEAQVARGILGLLDLAVERPIKVAILTGYAPQAALMRRLVSARTYKRARVECSTIDAFQGRETDVVVYLVTRSNAEGRIGFLREKPRLNVALSRARDALIIIGDDQFIERGGEPLPRGSPPHSRFGCKRMRSCAGGYP